MLDFWLSVLEQGLLFSIMVIGVYITYKILDFPDLSVDGSFPLGASVTAFALIHGVNPFVACFLSFLAGCASGAVTGILHVKLKITNILSGILVMIALYSINLRVMGKANIPLFNIKTIFISSVPPVVIIAIFALAVKLLLDLFLKTKFGFLLRATGDNAQLITSLGINISHTKLVGLMVSNGFVALSGAMMAQYQGFSDVGMGSGTIVMGLASIILGETLFRKVPFMLVTTMAILGSILYKASVAAALRLGLPPTDLKLITAVIVVLILALNQTKISSAIKKILPFGGEPIVTNTKSM